MKRIPLVSFERICYKLPISTVVEMNFPRLPRWHMHRIRWWRNKNYRNIKSKGIKIPEEIADAGFGNDYWASIIEPGLTTYEQKPFEIEQTAGKLMLELLTGKKQSTSSQLVISKGELIVRKSS